MEFMFYTIGINFLSVISTFQTVGQDTDPIYHGGITIFFMIVYMWQDSNFSMPCIDVKCTENNMVFLFSVETPCCLWWWILLLLLDTVTIHQCLFVCCWKHHHSTNVHNETTPWSTMHHMKNNVVFVFPVETPCFWWLSILLLLLDTVTINLCCLHVCSSKHMHTITTPHIYWISHDCAHTSHGERSEYHMGHDDEDDSNMTPTIKKSIVIQQLPIIIIIIRTLV